MSRNVTGAPVSVPVCGDAAGEAAPAGLGDAAGEVAPAGLAAGLAAAPSDPAGDACVSPVVSPGVVDAGLPQLTTNISTMRRLAIPQNRLRTRTF